MTIRTEVNRTAREMGYKFIIQKAYHNILNSS